MPSRRPTSTSHPAATTSGPARSSARPVRVAVLGGRYELTEPLVFTPEDSGTEKSPTIFETIPGDKNPVILSGGVTLRKSGDVKDGKWVYPVDDDRPVRLIS